MFLQVVKRIVNFSIFAVFSENVVFCVILVNVVVFPQFDLGSKWHVRNI